MMIKFEIQIASGFSIPEIVGVDAEELVLLFEDKHLENSSETGLHCKPIDIKFCLFNNRTKQPIFTMDFFEICNRLSDIDGKRGIRLELIYVHDKKYRKMGIATHYIKKLLDFSINNGIDYIKVAPTPEADNFKGNGGMDKKELINFYKRFSNDQIPWIIHDLDCSK